MTRILVVDDHPVVREGLAAILDVEPGLSVVGQAGDGDSALALAAAAQPDVVVLDLRLPGIGGVDVCRQLAAATPAVRILILTSFPDSPSMLKAFEAGARGFAVKESDPGRLREAVRVVAGGGTYVDPKLASKLVALASRDRRARGPFGLTGQELRLLELLPKGLSTRELGAAMGISENTVKTHVKNTLGKLGARDRAEAATIALREGLI